MVSETEENTSPIFVPIDKLSCYDAAKWEDVPLYHAIPSLAFFHTIKTFNDLGQKSF